MTRQVRYQRRKRRAGKCVLCGNRAARRNGKPLSLCPRHRRARQERYQTL